MTVSYPYTGYDIYKVTDETTIKQLRDQLIKQGHSQYLIVRDLGLVPKIDENDIH